MHECYCECLLVTYLSLQQTVVCLLITCNIKSVHWEPFPVKWIIHSKALLLPPTGQHTTWPGSRAMAETTRKEVWRSHPSVPWPKPGQQEGSRESRILRQGRENHCNVSSGSAYLLKPRVYEHAQHSDQPPHQVPALPPVPPGPSPPAGQRSRCQASGLGQSEVNLGHASILHS